MPESKGNKLGSPDEEITDGLAVTNPYPKDGPPQLKLEVVTGEYSIGERKKLVTKMNQGVPSELMIDGQTIPEELTSADITVFNADEAVVLPSIPPDPAREGVPADKIYELTTQQLADAIVSGPTSEAVPTRMITEVTTELLSPEQVETAALGSKLNAKIKAVFDDKVDEYLGELDEALRLILQGVRDKVCAKFEGMHVKNVDEVVEAISVQMGIVIEAVITRQFGKLINQGYISVRAPE